jgi:hypothetical protein
MIVPLSVTFGGDYADLREALLNRGRSWFSSFDNIPAAVFAGVSQRCTIALSSVARSPRTFVAPMHRWRSVFRPCLMETIAYSDASAVSESEFGLPKVGDDLQVEVLHRSLAAENLNDRAEFSRSERFPVFFAPAARNFVSVFIQAPPVLDAESWNRLPTNQVGGIEFPNRELQQAALAASSGELFFWYWLVRGDGFHVTTGVIRDFLGFALGVPADKLNALASLGQILDGLRLQALVFKKNAGKYVGNYNYRPLAAITRRADLVLASGLGLSRSEIIGIFDYVQRVLAINDQAGEKAIPHELKARFSTSRDGTDLERHEAELEAIDRDILSHYGFTGEELDFIINYDVKYRMGLDWNPEAA